MIKLFYSKLEFRCNLDGNDLKKVFYEWDKERSTYNSYSYEYYIKKEIGENDIVLSRFTAKIYEAQDIKIQYQKDFKVLKVEIRPNLRSYVLFLIVPLSIIALNSNKDVKAIFWLIPIVAFLVLFIFFKAIVIIERKSIMKEIERVLIQKGIKYSL